MAKMKILLANGKIVRDEIERLDLLIEDGVIKDLKPKINAVDAEIIDCTGMTIAPGFIDLHMHLREPGYEKKETIKTGTMAAARGGYTTICPMPNTNPFATAPNGWRNF